MIAAFYLVVLPLMLLVVPTLAGIYLARARARRDLLHEPHCRNCRAAIGFEVATGLAVCGGCQRPVSETGEPLAGRKPGRIAPPILALVALVTTWAVAIVAAQLTSRTMSTTVAMGQRSTSQMMSDSLAGQSMFGSDGVELVRRARAGEDVVGIAREQLRAAIALRAAQSSDGRVDVLPAVANSEGPARVAAVALCGPGSLADQSGAGPRDIDEPTTQALARDALIACFPKLVLECSALAGGGAILRPKYTGFESPGGELRRVVVVRSVEIDGAPVAFDSTSSIDRNAPVLLRVDRPLRLPTALPAQARLVRVHCLLHLYDGLDGDRIADARGSLLPAARWPKPITTMEVTLEASLGEGSGASSGTDQ